MANTTQYETSELVEAFYQFLHAESSETPEEILAKASSAEQRGELEHYMRLVGSLEGLAQISQLEFPEDEAADGGQCDEESDIQREARYQIGRKPMLL